MNKSEVLILGTIYKLYYRKYTDDPEFERNNLSGYCDSYAKEIIVGNLDTFKSFEDCSIESRRQAEMEIIRHEIVHAYLYESGLWACGIKFNDSWAINEEMVDWFAIQGPKIMKTWIDLNVIG